MTLAEIRAALRSKNLTTAANAMLAACKEYGRLRNENGRFWNCTIDYFDLINDKSKVYVNIYWQGSDTDGDEGLYITELISEFSRGRDFIIPAQSYFDGERTRYKHSDLRITKDMLIEAFEHVADWLEDDAIKARAEKAALVKRKAAVTDIIDTYRSDTLYRSYGTSGWQTDSKWHNGNAAVKLLAEKHWEKLEGKTEEEIIAITRKVFLDNYHIDSWFKTEPAELTWQQPKIVYKVEF